MPTTRSRARRTTIREILDTAIELEKRTMALYVGFVRGDWKSELVNLAFGALLFLTGRLLERRFARA